MGRLCSVAQGLLGPPLEVVKDPNQPYSDSGPTSLAFSPSETMTSTSNSKSHYGCTNPPTCMMVSTGRTSLKYAALTFMTAFQSSIRVSKTRVRTTSLMPEPARSSAYSMISRHRLA